MGYWYSTDLFTGCLPSAHWDNLAWPSSLQSWRSHQEALSDSAWLNTLPPAFQPPEQMESRPRASCTFLSSHAGPFLRHNAASINTSYMESCFAFLLGSLSLPLPQTISYYCCFWRHTNTYIHFLAISDTESKISTAHRYRELEVFRHFAKATELFFKNQNSSGSYIHSAIIYWALTVYQALSEWGTWDTVVGKAHTDSASKLPSQWGLSGRPVGNCNPFPQNALFTAILCLHGPSHHLMDYIIYCLILFTSFPN